MLFVILVMVNHKWCFRLQPGWPATAFVLYGYNYVISANKHGWMEE